MGCKGFQPELNVLPKSGCVVELTIDVPFPATPIGWRGGPIALEARRRHAYDASRRSSVRSFRNATATNRRASSGGMAPARSQSRLLNQLPAKS